MDKVLSKMANNKCRRDLITGLWIKRILSLKKAYKGTLKDMLNRKTEPPEWLLTAKSILLSKTDQTRNPQNYRPIALQNIMYKIYTAILAEFVTDHCEENKIITEEQAAAKRKSWGCIDQLLINKTVYDDVKKNQKNLFPQQLDYREFATG